LRPSAAAKSVEKLKGDFVSQSPKSMKEKILTSLAELDLPVTNRIHINVDRLAETLATYESDSYGFPDQIPRLR